jgi:hypothetical protein
MQDPAAQPPKGYVNAVDITGAKKSMVVGAFLYAAHSGLPITYVDFDRYSSEWGKPYGYTCKIGQLADPYEVFGLRNWERVRQLYDRHNFRDAIGLIEGIPDQQEIGILEVMSRNLEGNQERSKLYDTGDQEKVGQLLDVLRMYEAWDSGDFQGALQLVHGLPEQVAPSVVTTLGNSWPLVTDAENVHWPIEIYIDAEKLTIYAYDELKRIERLIQYRQDFRSAFLRAGGLSEVLMTARIVAFIQDSSVKNAFLDALSQRTPTAEKMFKSLLQPVGASIALNDLGLRNAPKTSVTIGNRMIDWWQHTQHFADATGWQTFLDRRNVLTHRYVAVSEALAQDALRFTTANLEDFTGKSLESLEVTAHAAEWKELSRLLELDFLPPNLLT